jgi:hypothetical protein
VVKSFISNFISIRWYSNKTLYRVTNVPCLREVLHEAQSFTKDLDMDLDLQCTILINAISTHSTVNSLKIYEETISVDVSTEINLYRLYHYFTTRKIDKIQNQYRGMVCYRVYFVSGP